MCYGVEKVKNKMKEIDLQGNSASTKDKNMYAILELVLEMYEEELHSCQLICIRVMQQNL